MELINKFAMMKTMMLQMGSASGLIGKIPGLKQLKAGFDLAIAMGVDVPFVIRLASTDRLDLPFYRQQADRARENM